MTEPTPLIHEDASETTGPAVKEPQSTLETTVAGTYCPKCGSVVPFHIHQCPGCGHLVEHQASMVQRYGLLGGLGFIILGGIVIFLQQGTGYHTFQQDILEIGIIVSVAGAGICFFIAVVDMVRRGGE